MKKKLSILLALAVIIAALTLSVSAAGVVEPVPITPNMSQEEVDDAVAKAAESGAVLAVEPGNYGIEGENNHIKITLKHRGERPSRQRCNDLWRCYNGVQPEPGYLCAVRFHRDSGKSDHR